ncbi:Uncharacterised protein [Bordetella pertussis]|nr:Uncharacterised protein [Bordetella pertussis]
MGRDADVSLSCHWRSQACRIASSSPPVRAVRAGSGCTPNSFLSMSIICRSTSLASPSKAWSSG